MFLSMKRSRVFEVSYLPATNTRGSRIKIKDSYYDESVTIPYGYKHNNLWEAAAEFLGEKGIIAQSISSGKRCDYVMAEEFMIRIK